VVVRVWMGMRMGYLREFEGPGCRVGMRWGVGKLRDELV